MTDIPGYEGFYAATKDGKIYSHRAGKFLTLTLKPHGYMQVELNVLGTTTYHRVHRLIALTFIDNPDKKPFVNHLDGNKQNNDVSNLEWVTGAENNIHAVENNLVTFKENVYEITKPNGEVIEVSNLSNAAKAANTSVNTILNLVKSGKIGRNGISVRKVHDRRCND